MVILSSNYFKTFEMPEEFVQVALVWKVSLTYS